MQRSFTDVEIDRFMSKLPAMLAGGRFKETSVDAGIFALILGVCGAVFSVRWPAWEDQCANLHDLGLVPRHATVRRSDRPELAGNSIAAYRRLPDFRYGRLGIALVDLCFTLGLLVASSYLLSLCGTSRMIRLLICTAYLANYFGTTWAWTAQRESFCWPLFVISAIPLLAHSATSGARNAGFGKKSWLIFGIAAGFSLWIKPVAWPAIGTAIVAALLFCDREKRAEVRRGVLFYIAGITAVSLAFLAVLLATGTLSGFIKWGIYYDLGPYSKVKWPWSARLRMTYSAATNLSTEPLPLLLVGGGIVASLALSKARARWRVYRRPVAVAAAIAAASLMAALMQGKTHSAYHFIPFKWGVAYLAGVMLTLIPHAVVRTDQWSSDFGRHRADSRDELGESGPESRGDRGKSIAYPAGPG